MNPELVKKARNLMARASVVADRKGTHYNKTGGGGKPSSMPPTGYTETTVQFIHAMFARCSTDAQLEDAIVAAEKELASIQRTVVGNEDSTDRNKRLLKEGWGKDAEEVARWEGVPVKWIWQLRRDAGMKPRDGTPMGRKADTYRTHEERVEVVKRIHRDEPDVSLRQIAMRLGVSHAQVQRDLRDGEKAAA